jgi:hypothetical protein
MEFEFKAERDIRSKMAGWKEYKLGFNECSRRFNVGKASKIFVRPDGSSPGDENV